MFLPMQPSDPSHLPVLVVACLASGISLGAMVFIGRSKLQRMIRNCVAWVNACLCASGLGHRRDNVLPGPAHTSASHTIAHISGFGPPSVSPTSISPTSMARPIDYPPWDAGPQESTQDATVAQPSMMTPSGMHHGPQSTSSTRSISGNSAHALPTASELGLWDDSVIPWGLIAASATPCVSSVFEDDTEDEGDDGEVHEELAHTELAHTELAHTEATHTEVGHTELVRAELAHALAI